MSSILPPAGQKLVRPDGGMDQTWYEKLRAAFKSLDDIISSFGQQSGQLGTAAFEDIGTSGESVPLLNTANTFSKAQTFDVVELTDAASIAWDWSLGPIAKVTLTDNRALAAPTNTGKAGTWALFVRQDGTGNRTLTFDAAYLFAGGNDPTLSTSANAIDVLTCVSDGASIACSLAKSMA
jgi:hypothetical protein